MRVLVTGGAGFIGSVTSALLVGRGDSVVALDSFSDLLYPAQLKRLRATALECLPRLTFVDRDLVHDDLSGVLEGCDGVIHFAALPGQVLSWTRLGEYTDANLVATARLAQALVDRTDTFLVHASSSSVYGATAEGDETQARRPISPYGVTKKAAEDLLTAYGVELGLRFTALRFFSVYGTGQRPDMAVNIFIRKALERQPIRLFGDGSKSRQMTYVTDAATAAIRALDRQPLAPFVDVAGGESTSMSALIDQIATSVGQDLKVRFERDQIGDQVSTGSCSSLSWDVLGYAPEVSLSEGVGLQTRWQREVVSDPSVYGRYLTSLAAEVAH